MGLHELHHESWLLAAHMHYVETCVMLVGLPPRDFNVCSHPLSAKVAFRLSALPLSLWGGVEFGGFHPAPSSLCLFLILCSWWVLLPPQLIQLLAGLCFVPDL